MCSRMDSSRCRSRCTVTSSAVSDRRTTAGPRQKNPEDDEPSPAVSHPSVRVLLPFPHETRLCPAGTCAGLSWGPQTVDELVRRGFVRKVPTYQQINESKNRQCNNTYYILDLPPLPDRSEKRAPQVKQHAENHNGRNPDKPATVSTL